MSSLVDDSELSFSKSEGYSYIDNEMMTYGQTMAEMGRDFDLEVFESLRPILHAVWDHIQEDPFGGFGPDPVMEKTVQRALTVKKGPSATTPLEERDSYMVSACTFIYGLGETFSSNYSTWKSLPDLHVAILLFRIASEYLPTNNREHSNCLHSLTLNLIIRFELLSNPSDLEDVIVVLRHALGLLGENRLLLGRLAKALYHRYNKLGVTDDIDEAIGTIHRVLQLIPDHDEFNKIESLHLLGRSYLARSEHLGTLADIEKAIEALQRAIEEEKNPFHVLQRPRLRDLGFAWRARLAFPDAENASHFALAYGYLIRAAEKPDPNDTKTTSWMEAAQDTVSLCAKFPQFSTPDMALRAHQAAVSSIPTPSLHWLGWSISNRYERLSRLQVSDKILSAASAAMNAGKNDLGLEWLEQGRTLVWAQLLRLRTPLNDLHKSDPQRALEFGEISSALSSRELSTVVRAKGLWGGWEPKPGAALDDRSKRWFQTEETNHERLSLRYDEVLADIRQLDGFQKFLYPKTFAELAHAWQDGPISVINVQRSQCDCLVLCQGGQIIRVPLPDFTLDIAEAMRSTLIDFMRDSNTTRRGMRGAARANSNAEGMINVLESLWMMVVRPILLSVFGEPVPRSRTGQLPHMTWCPTGPLAFLPIHAAGIYSEERDKAQNTSSFVVSSYTPSLEALLHSQSRTERATSSSSQGQPSILVISQPNTPGLNDLPSTVQEAHGVLRHFGGDCVKHLDDTAATVETVVDSVQRHSWVHFACHGIQDPADPSKSAFFLHDGPLDLARLMALPLQGAELAVLSACETAMGAETLPEEAIHLSAGMLAAGYPSVIATMWSIADEDGPVLTDALYASLKASLVDRHLEQKGLNVAYALHNAVETLKDKIGEKEFLRWIPFVHFGI